MQSSGQQTIGDEDAEKRYHALRYMVSECFAEAPGQATPHHCCWTIANREFVRTAR